MTSISDSLDIFLITYNRAKSLDKTLSQILSVESPIRDFEIQIIDNNSTDNTREIVAKWQEEFPNLKYEKNKYNIGGNANIVNAFYKANKDYVWVLCDDDNYEWSTWNEVVDSILSGVDCIIVANTDIPKVNEAQMFAQTSFVPGTIYKMANFDETLLDNMLYNISNMFPHLAFSAKLINENKKFKIVSSPIVLYGGDPELDISQTYIRGTKNQELHPYRASLSYQAGYANSLLMIKDKNKRHEIAEKRLFYPSSLSSAETISENFDSLYNLFCIFIILSPAQKLRFILNAFLTFTLYKFCYVYARETYDEKTDSITRIYWLRLFNFLKTKIFKVVYTVKLGGS